MKLRQVVTVTLALAATWTVAAAAQQTPEVLYQAALYQEQVRGDLQQAVTLYQRILARHPADRAVDAKAQLHIGLCYESLGQAEARRAYEQVIANYADQRDEVREARAHLAALQPAAVASRGPVARELLSSDDIDENDLMEVAPSPDGRRMAYVQWSDTGGLIVRDLATGREQVVDSGLPRKWNGSPVWSPDGKRLAFEQTDERSKRSTLQIIDLDTRLMTTVPQTDSATGSLYPADWSRDGRFLLCRVGEGEHPAALVLVPVAGGPTVHLADSVTPDSKATLSPDGRFVAYAVGQPDSAQVFVQPVAEGTRHQIVDAPGGNVSPMWSPDGRAIAYGRADGIWVVPMRNGQQAGASALAYATPSDWFGTPGRSFWGWTETGGLFFSAFNGEPTAYRFPVDPATGRPGVGAPERLPRFPKNFTAFAWSPDMRQVAFGGFKTSDISVYSADRRELAVHEVEPPPVRLVRVLTWIEGGKEVVYPSADRHGAGLVALDPVTGQLRELIAPRTHRSVLQLSPDGRRMAYRGPGGLFVADTGGASRVLVAPDTDQHGAALVGPYGKISPRGDYVLFGRANLNARGEPAGARAASLWVVRTDGTGARRLGTPMLWLHDAVWDPSGRFVAYTGQADSTTNALRVVDVATGAVHEFPLPDNKATADLVVTDWSPDGKYLGVVLMEERAEYWVVQGLQGGQR